MNEKYFRENSLLRRKAEDILSQGGYDITDKDLTEVKAIIHELRVHQIELELQNEELRNIQDQLEKSNHRYGRLFNAAPIGYLTMDTAGLIMQANQTFIGMVQTNMEQLFCRPLTDFLAEEGRDQFRARYRAFFKRPDNKTLEVEMLRQDGHRFFARLEGRLETMDGRGPDREKQPVMFMVVTDITEMKRAEEEERRNAQVNAAMAGLAEALLGGACIEQTSSIILTEAQTLTNSPYGFIGYVDRFTGHLISPSFSREVWAECHIIDQPFVFEDVKGLCGWVLNNGRPLMTNHPDRDERSWNSPQGEIHIDRFLSVPVTINGRVVGLMALCNAPADYQERHLSLVGKLSSLFGLAIQRMQSEEDLRLAKEAAETASIAKSHFLATMSHEIRTPMNAILGFTELTLEAEPGHKHREHLEIVLSSAKHLLGLLNDLLDLAKIESGKMEIENREFDLPQAVKKVFTILSARAQEKDLRFDYQVLPDRPMTLIGDDYRLSQVLLNLIGNAIKFTEKGWVGVEVLVEEMSKNRVNAHFVVKDTGIGIPLTKKEQIFEPFTQADSSSTRQYGGTGLGLAICQKLVDAMNGTIWVESELNKGSHFHFTIPFRCGQPVLSTAEKEQQLPKIEDVDMTNDLAGPVVLLVEDNPINQKLVTILLKRKGCEVLTAVNGRQAIGLYQEKKVDLILMDIEMPGMNGMDAAAAIREMESETRAHIPIVAMTAHAMKGDRDRFIGAGMDDYLSKPIDAAVLYGIIDRYAASDCQRIRPRGLRT